MKIAITGANGYLGTRLVQLLRKKHDILAIDIINSNLGMAHEIIFKKIDLCCLEKLEKVIPSDIDLLIHLAGVVGVKPCEENKKRAFILNVKATEVLARVCHKYQIPIILPTSIAVLGKPISFPITENHSRKPSTYYGQTKLLAEKYVAKIAEKSFPAVSLMITNMYGHHIFDQKFIIGNYGVINNYYLNLKSNKELIINRPGTQKLNFIHVKDVADCFVFAIQKMNHLKNGLNTYIIGSTDVYSVNQLASCIRDITKGFKKKVRFKYSKIVIDKKLVFPNFIINANKAQKDLGFKAKINLKNGLYELFSTILKTPA